MGQDSLFFGKEGKLTSNIKETNYFPGWRKIFIAQGQ